MNKRQKKKRALQSQVNFLIAENALLLEAQENGVRERRLLEQRLTELEKSYLPMRLLAMSVSTRSKND